MNHRIDPEESKRLQHLVERVSLKVFGKYSVVSNVSSQTITKTEYGKNCIFGRDYYVREDFDSIGVRKKAYKTSYSELYGRVCGRTHNSKSLIDNKDVIIFKKKKRKNL